MNYDLEERVKKIENRRYPAGFYTLGHWIPGDGQYAQVKQWSEQGLVMLSPGEEKLFSKAIQFPTKMMSVHSWGLCRLVSVTVGHMTYTRENGALFVIVDKAFEPGYVFNVKIQALDFEPLSEAVA